MSFRSFRYAHHADRLPGQERDVLPLRRRPRCRSMLSLVPLAVMLLVSAPVPAQGYATRDVGRWTVSASSDQQGCFLTRTFQGPGETTLLLGLDVDGDNRLTIVNANWSIRPQDKLRLNFRLSNASFPRHFAVGIAANDKKGFVTSFGASFPATFAASKFLHVARDDVPVEELGLEGSGAAVTELRKCVAFYRDAPATAGSRAEHGSRIPLDPFAAGGSRRHKK
ncbi:hypothetical protein [uncultured Sphingomonas sp.]|uniref:hypothetical protein n=1 Tax=uncultured Sphingomonas sp. TaxID=158754 RepID=UPI0025D5EB0A|nr:hypothetical protein [uncultured Sphingomonas sp.]